MVDVLMSVMSGGVTGILGSVIGKVFNFVDMWAEEKKKDKDHIRTIELTRLNAELRADEMENELAIVEEEQAGAAKVAAYTMFQDVAVPYPFVAAILRLIRPVLTIMLISIVWYIFATTEDASQKEMIIQSVIWMSSTATMFWFGDRALRPKK
jgi:hypothetical protein